MSNVEIFTDGLLPSSGTTVSLYNTAISGDVPIVNQVLTATNSTSGEWQTGVSALKTSGVPVVVNGSEAVSNQVLQASSPTVASWKYFSTLSKSSVRTASIEAGVLASDFENGDTLDGIVLVTGDRILIKDQSIGTENGIYEVQISGAPIRVSDFDTGITAGGIFVFIQEGNANKQLGYICTNTSGNDITGTDSLIFRVFSTFGNKILVNTITSLRAALINGAKHIQIASGTYITTQIDIIQNDVVLEGLGNVVLQKTGAGQLIFLDGCSNVTLKNINLDTNGSGRCVRIENGCSNITFDLCSIINIGSSSVGIFGVNDPDGLLIKDCTFNNSEANCIGIALNGGNDIIISGCHFSSVDIMNIYIQINSDNFIVKECFFETGAITGIRVLSGTNGSSNVIVSDCMFRDQTTASINVELSAADAGPVIISNCHFDSTEGITSTARLLVQGCHFADVTDNGIFLDTADSGFSSIINNAFLNPTGFAVQIGNDSDNNLIADNAFEPLTSTGSFVDLVSIATVPLTRITRNNAVYLLDIPGGTVNYNGDFDVTVGVNSSGGRTMSLQDLTQGSFGHYTSFRNQNPELVIIPVTITANSLQPTFTVLYLLTSNDSTALQWTGRGWKLFSFGTASLTP